MYNSRDDRLVFTAVVVIFLFCASSPGADELVDGGGVRGVSGGEVGVPGVEVDVLGLGGFGWALEVVEGVRGGVDLVVVLVGFVFSELAVLLDESGVPGPPELTAS